MIGPRELGITAKSFFDLVFRTAAEEGQNAASRLAGMASSRKDRNRTQLDGRNRIAASRLAGMASSRKDRNRTQLDGRNRWVK